MPADYGNLCGKNQNANFLKMVDRAGLGGRAAMVTIESGMRMDGDPEVTAARARTLPALDLRKRTHFDIAPDGSIFNCKVVEAVGMGTDACSDRVGPFTAVTETNAARPRSASKYFEVVLQPAP